MRLHTGGCTDSIRESALEVKTLGEKSLAAPGTWTLHQYCAWLFSWTLCQLSCPRHPDISNKHLLIIIGKICMGVSENSVIYLSKGYDPLTRLQLVRAYMYVLCVYLALWTWKVLCGSFLCTLYKFSFFLWFFHSLFCPFHLLCLFFPLLLFLCLILS